MTAGVVRSQLDGYVLKVEPTHAHTGTVDGLQEWLTRHRKAMTEHLEVHGAVLLRGFGVETAADFQRVALAVNPDLTDRYPGGAPRTKQAERVWNASELPPHLPLPSHCELSYLPQIRPRQILFCCTEATCVGGETPIARMDHVYQALPPRLQAGIPLQVVRYFPAEHRRALDVRRLRSRSMPWPDVLQATDPEQVAADAAKDGASVTFHSPGLPPLLQRLGLPASAARLLWPLPVPLSDMATEERTANSGVRLVSQAPLVSDGCYSGVDMFFHEYGWLVEMCFVFWRSRALRDLLVLAAITACTLALGAFRAVGLVGPAPLDLRDLHRDRSLPVRDVWAINKAYWSSFVFHKWQKGDVVILNNSLCSHGRLPYHGRRTLLTAFG